MNCQIMFIGKCLRSLYAEMLYLLLVVSGEVSSIPESSKYQGKSFWTQEPSANLPFHFPLLQNAYTATAINSTNFCTSARDAFVILVENALRVAAINTVGDFVLFLGKVMHTVWSFTYDDLS